MGKIFSPHKPIGAWVNPILERGAEVSGTVKFAETTNTMQIDPALHSHADTYKILTNLIVPRPIAWITTADRSGVVNLAPFSFFNAVGGAPPYLAVGIGRRDDGTLKDTAANIECSADFVVNLVTDELLDAMNISAADFPPNRSELTAVGLHAAPAVKVMAPRLSEAQVSLECRLFRSLALGANTLHVGEVVMFHVADHLIGARLHVNDFAPIGRLGSPSVYCRTTNRFDLPRVSYADWETNLGPSKTTLGE
jgi:flavin reductase (DIM6/NTAB) family NADH-FMN oxidoreductase RutF